MIDEFAGWRASGKNTELLWTVWTRKIYNLRQFKSLSILQILLTRMTKYAGEPMNLRQNNDNKNVFNEVTKLNTWQKHTIKKSDHSLTNLRCYKDTFRSSCAADISFLNTKNTENEFYIMIYTSKLRVWEMLTICKRQTWWSTKPFHIGNFIQQNLMHCRGQTCTPQLKARLQNTYSWYLVTSHDRGATRKLEKLTVYKIQTKQRWQRIFLHAIPGQWHADVHAKLEATQGT